MTAVVTDVHYRMSLALVRDLAQAGVRVVCCEGEDQPAPLGFASKYPAERVTLPRSGELDGLYRLCGRLTREEGERPALLPVGAATLSALAGARREFSKVAGLLIPSPDQLDALNSKEQVSRLGARLGVPVPEPLDLSQPGELPLPCVVKPLCGEKFGLSASQRYVIARSRAQAESAAARFQDLTGTPPLVQAYLPGGGLGCSLLAEEGEVLASLCHRRLREYPVSGGPSSCCLRVDRPDLEDFSARLVRETGFSGLAMFEFKEDQTGAPRLLEVNPRVWGTFPLTRASRSGIPLLWCARSWARGNGKPPPPLPTPSPRACRMQFMPSDLAAGLSWLKRGRPGPLLNALACWLDPRVRDGLWEWGDPGPGLMYYRSLLKKERS